MGPSTAGELCSELEHRVQTALPELARALMGAPTDLAEKNSG